MKKTLLALILMSSVGPHARAVPVAAPKAPVLRMTPRFPPPPATVIPPRRPKYRLSAITSNCGYFARSPGDRPTVGQLSAPISYILVDKAGRRMAVFAGEKVLKEYKISLGFNPRGHKQEEGDGRTPEGKYYIDFKNPKSEYHLSLKISYPNQDDLRRAEANSQKPGSVIMVHGWPNRPAQRDLVKRIHEFDKRRAYPDRWTAGCIAVHDDEIEEIYAKTEMRTPIEICP